MMQAIPLAGRYRFLKRLSAGPSRVVWLAEDVESGNLVAVVRLAPRFGRSLDPMVGVQHPHLACLLDMIHTASRDELPEDEPDQPSAPIAVAEWVSGLTLHDALVQDTVSQYQAVQTVAYIASAVAAVHGHEACHGAISARSVVLERVDEGPGPVLTQVMVPPDGSYASPERLAGAGPSPQDDVWALHVLLYAALTGQRPFRARTREGLLQMMDNPSPVPLEVFGLDDLALQRILDEGFVKDVADRRASVHALETELLHWMSAHGAEQPIAEHAVEQADPGAPQAPQADEGGTSTREGDTSPPPATAPAETPEPAREPRRMSATEAIEAAPEEPAVAPTTAPRSPEPQQPHPPRRVLPAALGALGLITLLAVAAAGLFFAGGEHRDPSEFPAAVTTSAPAVTAPKGPANSPKTDSASAAASAPTAPASSVAQEPLVAHPDVTACVASYFSLETFANEQELAFVCDKADAREGAKTMRTKIVLGGGGKLTEGMNMWPRLGWHELLVYGMLRRKCCPGAPRIALPAPVGECPPVGQTVNALSAAFATGSRDLDAKHASFVAATTCAYRSHDRAYRYRTGPLSGGQLSYDAFVKRTAQR